MTTVKPKTSFLNFFRLLFRNKCGEALLLPMTKGKQWNDFAARIPANHYQYPKNSIREVTRNGFKFRLDISDYMQWLIYFGVSIEPREKLYQLVKPGMTVLDIGANIGETALAFSRLVGQKGVVHSFEPDPDTFAKLKAHIELNHAGNIVAHNSGLGDEEGTFQLEQNEKHSGGNRIGTGSGINISVRRGDTIVAQSNLSPGFIKIDVEGFEERVLRGLTDTIARMQPVIFIEVIDEYLRAQGSSAHRIIQWLSEHNYYMENAHTGEVIQPGNDHSKLHCDIIARPK